MVAVAFVSVCLGAALVVVGACLLRQRQCACSSTGAAAAGGRPRLLVVDDEPLVRVGVARLLERDFAVVVCDGVEAALDRVRASADAFDLVLCDVSMPDGGAVRLARELQHIAPALAARAVYFTAGVRGEEGSRFVAQMGRRVLSKPLDPDVFAALARELLNR